MQLSDGTAITYGKDAEGPGIVMEGGRTPRTPTENKAWRLSAEREGAVRYWRLASGTTLTRVGTQSPSTHFDYLSAQLDRLGATDRHPALVNGLESEAKRLLPKISGAAEAAFADFVSFLKQSFGYDEKSHASSQLVTFVDDLGPNLLVTIDERLEILPEIPKVFLAPKEWRPAVWRVANHWVGPILDPGVGDKEKMQFVGLTLPRSAVTSAVEGLHYYHAARGILMFEDWNQTPDAPHLAEFIRLIRVGRRPLQECIAT